MLVIICYPLFVEPTEGAQAIAKSETLGFS